MGVICRITESIGESGLGVVTLGAMPQIIPLAIAFQPPPGSPGPTACPTLTTPTSRLRLDHCCLVSNGRGGGVFQPLPPQSPEQTQQGEPLLIGLFALSVACEGGDLIGGASPHDLSQAVKEVGKKNMSDILGFVSRDGEFSRHRKEFHQ